MWLWMFWCTIFIGKFELKLNRNIIEYSNIIATLYNVYTLKEGHRLIF